MKSGGYRKGCLGIKSFGGKRESTAEVHASMTECMGEIKEPCGFQSCNAAHRYVKNEGQGRVCEACLWRNKEAKEEWSERW